MGEILERLATRVHQCYDGAGQVLAENEGAGHCESRDEIQPEFLPSQTDRDLGQEARQDHRGAGSPRRGAEVGPAREPGYCAGEHGYSDEGKEKALAQLSPLPNRREITAPGQSTLQQIS